MKKLLSGITGIFLLIIMWFPCAVHAGGAEGSISVYDGSVLKREYSYADLQSLWSSEGEEEYFYAGYNTYANYRSLHDDNQQYAAGPTVQGLLANAGIDTASLSDNDLIKFYAADNVSRTFTKKQFTVERYYYPSGTEGTECGAKGSEAAYKDRYAVPFIIDLKNTAKNSKLRMGQIAPNEQIWPEHLYDMTGIRGGKIVILRGEARTLPADISTSVNTEQYVLPGQEIVLNGGDHFSKVYYTVDGSEPTINADIYNYNSYVNPAVHVNIYAPQNEGQKITIKCRKIAFGSNDSPVQTFTYTVNTAAVQRILNDRKVVKGQTYTVGSQKYKVTEKSAGSNGTVTFTKAKKAKTATVPATVKLADGKTYQVTAIGAKAFAGTKATKIVVKTKGLKKASVRGSLKGSKVKTVKVKVGTKKQNLTYVKKYKKIFTKKNAGRKVKVTR